MRLLRPQAGIRQHREDRCVPLADRGPHPLDRDRSKRPRLRASGHRRLPHQADGVVGDAAALGRALQDSAEEDDALAPRLGPDVRSDQIGLEPGDDLWADPGEWDRTEPWGDVAVVEAAVDGARLGREMAGMDVSPRARHVLVQRLASRDEAHVAEPQSPPDLGVERLGVALAADRAAPVAPGLAPPDAPDHLTAVPDHSLDAHRRE